ncbi:hypothetical protein BGW38_006670 [Lunasporangiospora selenospora]|uniref:CUB domain-containing protein n=1 Tax=Lunasporangiospora selenospora TaxID=979761 RepID=A0A9P6KGS6_9FUNG|nr:hypothetical protein BGW38_006670 [Lunasporangiospora selenospora]
MQPSMNSSRAGMPYVVSLNFWSPIQLVCGVDYLTIYDGPDMTSPVIAKLCGNIWMDNTPTLYSSGPVMTAVFSTLATTPGSFGFTAGWTSVTPCNVCLSSGRGTCNNANCACKDGYTGIVCERETSDSKEFTPRSQHSMAYDESKDLVYVTGGTSFHALYIWDILTYTFSTNKWNKITIDPMNRSPPARYGHFSFVYKGELYIFGGVTLIGALADLWKFDGKRWTQLQPTNSDRVPSSRTGASCALITINNSTRLAVFGGYNAAGEATRELHFYDLALEQWTKTDHQNSVGLAGATAVYHRVTGSIYFFGGMVNRTTRNVVTYQYFIAQDLWYALAPRVDPLTATPVPPYIGNGQQTITQTQPTRMATNGTSEDEDEDSGSDAVNTTAFLPPVMYDPFSGVWSPAGLMGDDMVVMYGGMRPFGPGINSRDYTCFVRNMVIYDLSCQKWTSFNMADLTGVVKPRVNHTMILRPPGSAGGNKTSWTMYIFGGFDGWEHSDVIAVPLNVTAPLPSEVNSCRALRWCSYYNDCRDCNPNYCSYVGGLCLFDTDKAKDNSASGTGSSGSTSTPTSHYLLGGSSDVPRVGTLQDLIRLRPSIKSGVVKSDQCPFRTTLTMGSSYTKTIESGQELTFKIYIDAQDLDIQYEIKTLPSDPLKFKSLNVWEGYMNMFWRASHGVTDNSWDGSSWTSSPVPSDIPSNYTYIDQPVINPSGYMNVSELMNRWDKYSGLDASPSASALRVTTNSRVYFASGDPRRFSGYYVFSLTNPNPTALSFTLLVTLLDHPTDTGEVEKSNFNLATLGFFMLGFILIVLLLIVLGRKIRRWIESREEERAAVELRMLEEEEAEAEAEEERRRRMNGEEGGGGIGSMSGDGLESRKPMYRVVVGIQDLTSDVMEGLALLGPGLRYRGGKRGARYDQLKSGHGKDSTVNQGSLNHHPSNETICPPSINRSQQAQQQEPNKIQDPTLEGRQGQTRLDYIQDLGAGPSNTYRGGAGTAGAEVLLNPLANSGTDSSSALSAEVDWDERPRGAHGRDQWSTSAATIYGDGSRRMDGSRPRDGSNEMIPQFENGLLKQEQRRNPVLVQPISIEPVPFHGGLVPRTRRHYRRYARTLRRRVSFQERERRQLQQQQEQQQQEQQGEVGGGVGTGRRTFSLRFSKTSLDRRPTRESAAARRSMSGGSKKQVRNKSSSGSLVQIRRTASRMTQRTTGQSRTESFSSAKRVGDQNELQSPKLRSLPIQTQDRIGKDASALQRRLTSLSTRRRNPGSSEIELCAFEGSEDGQGNGPEVAISISDSDSSGIMLGNEVRIEDSTAMAATPLSFPLSSSSSSPSPYSRLPGSGTKPKAAEKKKIRMRGRLEYEPGPLLAMNVLIVFPGDSGTRPVMQQSDVDMVSSSSLSSLSSLQGSGQQPVPAQYQQQQADDEKRLPPMAVGTMFVPDPVRWWAYKAKQQAERRKMEREMKRQIQQQQLELQAQQLERERRQRQGKGRRQESGLRGHKP